MVSKKIKLMSILTILITTILVAIAVIFESKLKVVSSISYYSNSIYIDSLNVIQLILISTVSFIAAIYSYKYIKEEVEEKEIDEKSARLYYILFNLFVISMLVVSLSNNIVLMWIGLEATTLSTAFLIGFNKHKLSLEAAWKYIIICSVGIVLGLIGIILLIYASNTSVSEALNWTYLVQYYSNMNKGIVKFAFSFIFVGIGTKAGLAPMHTWLPDGHSESPSPISAMMSGVLLNLALYVIVRFYIIIRQIQGLHKMSYLFIVFGIISLIISSFSILKQKNYKRLLAFSSVENLGIITLGLGIGSKIAVFGAVLHSIVHAYGKTLLFLVSGNILSAYKTKRICKVKNLIKTMPINTVFLMMGILIITGVPPFASFFSEYSILIASIKNNNYIVAAIYTVCLLIVFAGFLKAFMNMIFDKSEEHNERNPKDWENTFPLLLTFLAVIFISLFSNGEINSLINRAVNIIIGN